MTEPLLLSGSDQNPHSLLGSCLPVFTLCEDQPGKCIILKDRCRGEFQNHIQEAYILLWSGINAESLSKILVHILKNIFGYSESKIFEEEAM